jgi:hypothetical protein
MKKNTKVLLAVLFLIFCSAAFLAGAGQEACAQSSLWQAQEGFGRNSENPVGEVFGEETPEDPRVIAAELIKIALGFVGIIMVILIIVAGFRWMTSAGNQETISKAKSQITSAIIGLIIIAASYALTEFITSCVYGITNSDWMCSR